jgi:hypothetical protein
MLRKPKNPLRSRTRNVVLIMSELQDVPTSTTPHAPWRERPAPKRRGVRVGAVIAIAAIIAFGVWLAVGRSSGGSSGSGSTLPKGAVPARISLQGLTTLGGVLTQPIYWAGSEAGKQYELTKANDGRVWIRYLPTSAKIGEQGTPYLTIGTYPVTNAFAATQAVAKSAVRIPVGKGAVAFYRTARPTNVYIAYRGSDYQVEVFAPSAKVAQGLVASGKIELIPGSTAASTHASSTGAVALTRLQLVDRAKGAALPIYWIGVKPSVSYELTQTAAGRSYVRYLPTGVRAGASAPYLTIGTYPLAHALAVTKAAAKGKGVVTITIAGGFAFYKTSSPTNVHIAYPGKNFQIEVYDPSAAQAHTIVASGDLVPVQ